MSNPEDNNFSDFDQPQTQDKPSASKTNQILTVVGAAGAVGLTVLGLSFMGGNQPQGNSLDAANSNDQNSSQENATTLFSNMKEIISMQEGTFKIETVSVSVEGGKAEPWTFGFLDQKGPSSHTNLILKPVGEQFTTTREDLDANDPIVNSIGNNLFEIVTTKNNDFYIRDAHQGDSFTKLDPFVIGKDDILVIYDREPKIGGISNPTPYSLSFDQNGVLNLSEVHYQPEG